MVGAPSPPIGVNLKSSPTGEQRTGNWELGTGNRELGTGNREWAISSLLESCAGGLRGSSQDRGQLGCFAEESAEILVQASNRSPCRRASFPVFRFLFPVHQLEGEPNWRTGNWELGMGKPGAGQGCRQAAWWGSAVQRQRIQATALRCRRPSFPVLRFLFPVHQLEGADH